MINSFIDRSTSSTLGLSLLTNNDSKILGNSLKQKSRKLHEQTHISSNKFKTLHSSWTPLVNKEANKTVFEERVELVSNWFDLWNDKQRKWFLLNILSRCRPSQICYVEDLFDNLGISERKDFTRVLPKYISQYIFSFLSPKDLSRCSQVSSHWKYISEQDEVWMPKCLKFGWLLPYTPFSRELGAWKAHYIDCVTSINAKPLTKEDAFKYREILFKRELTENEKEILAHSKSKHGIGGPESRELIVSRPPWQPNSQKPKDLKKSDKILYSFKLNLNQPAFRISSLKENFSNNEYLNTLKRSHTINNNMLEDFKQSLPLSVLKMKEAYKKLRKSESDLFKINLTNSSLDSYLNYSAELSKSKSLKANSLMPSYYSSTPNVIFISSKVACSYLVLESVKLDTISIPYDFESTNISSLLKLLELNLNGRRAKSIGLFLHFEKPGQLALTKDRLIYAINLDNDEISNFFMKLKENLIEIDNRLDFFVPLGSSELGLELIEKIHTFTGLNVRAPTGYLGNYRFIKSKWINCREDSPMKEYFVEEKLNVWLNYCDILNDAHDKVADFVLNGYANADLNKIAIQKITAKIVFDSLSGTHFLTNLKVQNDLADIINKTATLNEPVIDTTHFNALTVSLQNYLEAIETPNSIPTVQDKENVQTEEEKISNESLLKSDQMLKSFLKIKTEPESLEPSLRTQIALELVRSEIEYMKHLEIIQKYYAKPLKATLDSGHAVVSQSVIDLLFNDVIILLNLSKEMVKDFHLRLKTWRLDSCIADVLTKLTNNIQTFINYANNSDSILSTIDKLVSSNPKFRTFISRVDQTQLTNMMKIQDLLNAPWPRIKELLNLLSALQLYTAKSHPDQANIQFNLNRLRQFYVFQKQLQDRLEDRFKMARIHRDVLDLPNINKEGRSLLIQQRCVLLNKLNLNFVKEITCFLFNDSVLFAYRIKQHYPFTKYNLERLIHFDFIEDLIDLSIIDILDSKHALNVIQLKFNEDREYTIGFDTFEAKFNFVKLMKLTAEL